LMAKLGSARGAAKRRTLPPALAAHCWRPGESGNPSGHSGAYGEALSLARQAAPDAVRRLIELMGSDDERVAAVACNSILDRALGKPREQPGEAAATQLEEMSAQQRLEWAERLVARAQRLLAGPADRASGAGSASRQTTNYLEPAPPTSTRAR